MSFHINDRCTGCSACVRVCPTAAIRGARDDLHVIDPTRCIECGACGITCPDAAVLDPHGTPFSLHEPSPRPLARVDLAACTGCGWCLSTCPWDALSTTLVHGSERSLRVITVHTPRCVACGSCELECNQRAIVVLRPSDPRVPQLHARNEDFLRKHGALP